MNKGSKVYLVTVGGFEIRARGMTRSRAQWAACLALANRVQCGASARKLAAYFLVRTRTRRLPFLDSFNDFWNPQISKGNPTV